MITLVALSISHRVFLYGVPASALRHWAIRGGMSVSLQSERSSVSSLNDGITHATDVTIVGKRASVCGCRKDCDSALRGSGACVVARQAYHLTQILRAKATRSQPRVQGKSEL